jgi:hypothetical protein
MKMHALVPVSFVDVVVAFCLDGLLSQAILVLDGQYIFRGNASRKCLFANFVHCLRAIFRNELYREGL